MFSRIFNEKLDNRLGNDIVQTGTTTIFLAQFWQSARNKEKIRAFLIAAITTTTLMFRFAKCLSVMS